MIRIAAVGDVHFDRNSAGRIRAYLPEIIEQADALLLAGDLTQVGLPEEAEVLAKDLAGAGIPIVAVLGNHDYHSGQEKEVQAILSAAGITVLEGNSAEFRVRDTTLGVAGAKGFGGGFSGACGTEFGEEEMKSFIRHTKSTAARLQQALSDLRTTYKVALMHYAPVPETLLGEKKEIYPFLGSYLLAEAVDMGKADIAFHGHAHKGTEKGATLGGVPVRNVAQPVIRHVCNIYTINKEEGLAADYHRVERAPDLP